MINPQRKRRLWSRLAATMSSVGLLTMLPSSPWAAEQGPAEQILEEPVAPPTVVEPQQVPGVMQPIEVHRPASVSDEEYAAEKARAKTAPAPMGAKTSRSATELRPWKAWSSPFIFGCPPSRRRA